MSPNFTCKYNQEETSSEGRRESAIQLNNLEFVILKSPAIPQRLRRIIKAVCSVNPLPELYRVITIFTKYPCVCWSQLNPLVLGAQFLALRLVWTFLMELASRPRRWEVMAGLEQGTGRKNYHAGIVSDFLRHLYTEGRWWQWLSKCWLTVNMIGMF